MTDEAERFNAGDPKAVRNRARQAQLADDQAVEDLRQLLASPIGRRFLWRQLEACNVWATSFNPNGQQFAHNEGRRSVGVELMARIAEADPQAWILMQQERLDEARKADV